MKKLYIILILAMTGIMAEAQTSVWNGSRKLWTRGEGTESNPYLIETAENLAFLAYMVNTGFETKGLHFELTTDIDLNGSEDQLWVPIGLGNNYFYEDGCERVIDYSVPNNSFRGHFDGGNHKIYNLYIKDSSFGGLFGSAEEPCEIKNVSVENGYIQNVEYGGGIVGKGGAIISNCSNGADISGNYVGGIVGYGAAKVVQCYNTGYLKGNNSAGGIAGMLAKEITECFNTGKVVAYIGGSGGIIGTSLRDVAIENCYNLGEIGGNAQNTGGIGGFIIKGTVKNCYNAGDIANSEGLSGGIIGSSNYIGTTDNVYYLNTCGGEGIGVAMSDVEMRDEAFVAVLNKDTNVWGFDKNNVNEGYPVLESFHLSTTEMTTAKMSVYPNPAKGDFTVEGTGQLIVTNVLGQKIMEKAIEERYNITLPKGLYLLRLTDGNNSATRKVMVY